MTDDDGDDDDFQDGLIREATLTCPRCGHRERLSMPDNACTFFHECAGCGALLKPEPGDCCVFCSYADIPCPPVQHAGRSCCGGN